MKQEEADAAFSRIFRGLHPTPLEAFRAGVEVGESGGGATECRRCGGKGYTNEGDPEIGNALFDCEACYGTGGVPAATVRQVQAMAVASAVSSAQVPANRVDPTACHECIGMGCEACNGTGDALGMKEEPHV